MSSQKVPPKRRPEARCRHSCSTCTLNSQLRCKGASLISLFLFYCTKIHFFSLSSFSVCVMCKGHSCQVFKYFLLIGFRGRPSSLKHRSEVVCNSSQGQFSAEIISGDPERLRKDYMNSNLEQKADYCISFFFTVMRLCNKAKVNISPQREYTLRALSWNQARNWTFDKSTELPGSLRSSLLGL